MAILVKFSIAEISSDYFLEEIVVKHLLCLITTVASLFPSKFTVLLGVRRGGELSAAVKKNERERSFEAAKLKVKKGKKHFLYFLFFPLVFYCRRQGNRGGGGESQLSLESDERGGERDHQGAAADHVRRGRVGDGQHHRHEEVPQRHREQSRQCDGLAAGH